MVDEAKMVVITGGNAGLGYETAKTIAAAGDDWHVLVAGRDPAKTGEAVRRLVAETGHHRIEGMTLDLASLASVRRFAAALDVRLAGGELPPLRAVVCNAGIQVVRGMTATEDGYETTFGVNHLGHFLLVNLLLPRLTVPARIVFVGSGTHDPANRLARLTGMPAPRWRDPEALARPDRFPDPAERGEGAATVGRRRYTTSKLATIYAAYELSRRLQAARDGAIGAPVTVNVFDPGLMPGSGLARDAGPVARFLWHRVLPAMRFVVPGVSSTRRSGRALARLVLDPTLAAVTGRYFAGLRDQPSSPESYDEANAAALWEASAALVALAPADAPIVATGKATAA
ncbi:MAG: Oxidoreductase, short-chain dehydrogenase/reductase family [uncultured Thermomicrobiales bacterium]|uniref:Oxidoreductase, short-chain dehydrogenase/reductase family n=1 Tax=uncultured Thermomicrobiales bacterium TaxID=1645740 RepID=A0A6J4VIC3_9BACT|nr:MAG: Oxidoreductase, short-chain dehydrogenase/reductase family [uncultured Thermomicrobiales bacterium]